MLLPLVLVGGVAEAAPRIEVTAEVDPGLDVVRGRLHLVDLDGASLVDPLSSLPIPSLEIARVRTWPGRPERGGVVWQRDGDDVMFEAHLPRRWEDTGATKRHGLFANGSWYPQPLVDGALPVVDWVVDLKLPDGAAGALGDDVGRGALHWEGTADRASLAVVPGGDVTVFEGDAWRVRLLTRKPARRGLRVLLGEKLVLATVSGQRWEGVAVEAPLRRRLSRPGAGLGYVSDRAWRVTPIFRSLHTAGALKGLVASWTGAPDGFTRELAGAALRRLIDDRTERQQTADLVGATKWIPIVDQALYSYEMDFRSELFDEYVPSDRTTDDLTERFAPHAPGALVVAQVEDRFGHDTADRLAEGLALGWTLTDAEQRLGLPTGWLAAWRDHPPLAQNYALHVDDDAVTVTREAPEGALEETVHVDVDGRRFAWTAPGGTSTAVWPVDEHPKLAVLDPERHLDEVSREDDRRPPRLRWTLWGRVWGLGVAPRYASIMGALTLRRESDTHNALRVWAWTSQRFFLGGRLSWTHWFGRVVRPSYRAHSITVGAEASWLDPAFGSPPDADYTVGGTLAYQWDNRRSTIFPRDGAQIAASVQAGAAPQTGQTYVRLQTGFQGDASVGPRHVLAARLLTGVAFTDIAHERLDLGGVDGVRGLPDQTIPTEVQGILSMDWRAVVAQDVWWSIAGLVWVRDLYVLTGMDVGIGMASDQQVGAVAGAVGLGATLELGGISPGSLNVVLAWPAWYDGFQLRDVPLEVRATWGVLF